MIKQMTFVANGGKGLTPFHSDGFPMHFDRMSMKLPFLYFKGSQIEFVL